MALPFLDLFTVSADTAIETYDGTSWPSTSGDNTSFTVFNATPNDQVRRETGALGAELLIASLSPSSADYAVTVSGATVGTATGASFGPVVRSDGNGLASANCYAFLVQGDGTYNFGEYTSGSFTSIASGTITAVSFVATTIYNVKLQFIGTAYRVTFDTIIEIEGTDSTHSTAGEPGSRITRLTPYIHNFYADYANFPGNILLLGVG